ncbi:MAG: ECF transporter S component [Chloroflexota bacterium]|nr:ECF transporter S component [Chloroflexota bacterium]
MRRASLSAVILILATLIGIVAFLYPFLSPPTRSRQGFAAAHSADAPLFFLVLLGLCLAVVVANLETRRMDSKIVAVLGVLVAVNAVLRLVPGPGGFSATFFLPILCGYAYGADFGFLLGALSLLVSAIVTGGIGPWLPYQMFAAGWMGMASGWLPDLRHRARVEMILLAIWGALLGLSFGVIINLWFWPYLGAAGMGAHWQPGLSLRETLGRYLLFYAVTSLWWDVGRAGGNLLLILLFGAPLLRLLRRFQSRFHTTIYET